MKCPKCGHEITMADEACKGCGAKLKWRGRTGTKAAGSAGRRPVSPMMESGRRASGVNYAFTKMNQDSSASRDSLNGIERERKFLAFAGKSYPFFVAGLAPIGYWIYVMGGAISALADNDQTMKIVLLAGFAVVLIVLFSWSRFISNESKALKEAIAFLKWTGLPPPYKLGRVALMKCAALLLAVSSAVFACILWSRIAERSSYSSYGYYHKSVDWAAGWGGVWLLETGFDMACLIWIMGSLVRSQNWRNLAEHAAQTQAVDLTNREMVRKTLATLGTGNNPGEEKSIALPGGATMEMVWCPPGRFAMGSPEDEAGRQPGETLHDVTLDQGFWMGKNPVTQAQWKSVMGSNPARGRQNVDSPIENVSWEECREFCERAGLEMPTEAQWEYACRAGSTGPFGGTGNLPEMGWYRENSGGNGHRVGQKAPNAWGLHDMHGNVWEWCSDWEGDYPSEATKNPKGSQFGGKRILRGGSFADAERHCRSANRTGDVPSSKNATYGFRVVAAPVFHEV